MELENAPGLTIAPCQLRPESRGHVRIKSADPSVYPSIFANYLADPLDQEVAVAGLKWARKIGQPAGARALCRSRDEPRRRFETDQMLLEYARQRLDDLSPGRHLPDGRGRARWPWSTPSCGCRACRGPAGGRRLGHAAPGLGQHQRPHHHDRRKGLDMILGEQPSRRRLTFLVIPAKREARRSGTATNTCECRGPGSSLRYARDDNFGEAQACTPTSTPRRKARSPPTSWPARARS
jgi:hypothetical protein